MRGIVIADAYKRTKFEACIFIQSKDLDECLNLLKLKLGWTLMQINRTVLFPMTLNDP